MSMPPLSAPKVLLQDSGSQADRIAPAPRMRCNAPREMPCPWCGKSNCRPNERIYRCHLFETRWLLQIARSGTAELVLEPMVDANVIRSRVSLLPQWTRH